jgi:hypothetical protein
MEIARNIPVTTVPRSNDPTVTKAGPMPDIENIIKNTTKGAKTGISDGIIIS